MIELARLHNQLSSGRENKATVCWGTVIGLNSWLISIVAACHTCLLDIYQDQWLMLCFFLFCFFSDRCAKLFIIFWSQVHACIVILVLVYKVEHWMINLFTSKCYSHWLIDYMCLAYHAWCLSAECRQWLGLHQWNLDDHNVIHFYLHCGCADQ